MKPLGPWSTATLVRRPAAVGAVVLRGHAADETRCAVTALRSAADRPAPRCTGCSASGVAEALGGDDLLAVEGRRPGTRQAFTAVQVVGVPGPGRRATQDRARAALPLRAPLLGSR